MCLWSISIEKRGQSIKISKNVLFNKWCWEIWTATCKKLKLNHQFTPCTVIDSKWIKDLNIYHDIIKVLEENIGRKISDILLSNIFTDMCPTARDIKGRLNKSDFIKIKSCMAKENISKMKKEPTVWEPIFANDFYDTGLISKIYKGLSWLQSRRMNNPIKKWVKDLNRQFSKKDIQRAERHVKGCSALLAIREI